MQKYEQCPKCGGTSGVYMIEYIPFLHRWTWDGTPMDSEELEDSKIGKMVYCRDCEQQVMRGSTFFGLHV